MLTTTTKVWLIKKYQKKIREVKMKFDQIGSKKVKVVRDLRHDQSMDKEKVIHEIKRDLRNPMFQRGLIIISMFFLMIIYHVLCLFTYCG